MDSNTLLKSRFAFVRKDLVEALGRVEDGHLSWAPAEGMPSIRDLLFEIAGTEVQILRYIREGSRIPLAEVIAPWDGLRTVVEIREQLEEVRDDTLAFLDGLSHAELEAPARFPETWFESLGLPEVPLREGFSSLAAHEWYHVGQLVSYLWARGDDPRKW